MVGVEDSWLLVCFSHDFLVGRGQEVHESRMQRRHSFSLDHAVIGTLGDTDADNTNDYKCPESPCSVASGDLEEANSPNSSPKEKRARALYKAALNCYNVGDNEKAHE